MAFSARIEKLYSAKPSLFKRRSWEFRITSERSEIFKDKSIESQWDNRTRQVVADLENGALKGSTQLALISGFINTEGL